MKTPEPDFFESNTPETLKITLQNAQGELEGILKEALRYKRIKKVGSQGYRNMYGTLVEHFGTEQEQSIFRQNEPDFLKYNKELKINEEINLAESIAERIIISLGEIANKHEQEGLYVANYYLMEMLSNLQEFPPEIYSSISAKFGDKVVVQFFPQRYSDISTTPTDTFETKEKILLEKNYQRIFGAVVGYLGDKLKILPELNIEKVLWLVDRALSYYKSNVMDRKEEEREPRLNYNAENISLPLVYKVRYLNMMLESRKGRDEDDEFYTLTPLINLKRQPEKIDPQTTENFLISFPQTAHVIKQALKYYFSNYDLIHDSVSDSEEDKYFEKTILEMLQGFFESPNKDEGLEYLEGTDEIGNLPSDLSDKKEFEEKMKLVFD